MDFLDELLNDLFVGDTPIITDHLIVPSPMTQIPHPDVQNGPVSPAAPSPSANPDSYSYPWDTPEHSYHNARVLCDEAGLTVEEKNVLCACIYQESGFYNYRPDGEPIKHENLNDDGSVSSTDWGLCQVNDYFHIGAGKDFPSVDYVMAHPNTVVEWMIKKYKAGQLSQWSSYVTGAYRQWLVENSPLWKLAVVS